MPAADTCNVVSMTSSHHTALPGIVESALLPSHNQQQLPLNSRQSGPKPQAFTSSSSYFIFLKIARNQPPKA
jgi:hypothetical protein